MNIYINNDADFSNYYGALQKQVRGEILRESEEQIIGTNEEELAKYFYDKYALSPIEEDKGREISWDIQDYLATVPAYKRESFHRQQGDLHDFQCQKVAIEVPIKPNEYIHDIARLRTSSYSISYSDRKFNWKNDKISTSVETKGYGFEYDENEIAKEVERAYKRIKETIKSKNSDIERGNRELWTYIQRIINERKEEITKNKDKIKSLTKKINIPLKKKESYPSQSINLVQKPIVQRIKPKATLPVEYILEESNVGDIIKFLDNQAKNFEKTPKAVKSLEEEDLRDLLLSNLNTIFEGDATGETFSKKGKTDIYLKIDKGNILVSECKIWNGKSLYIDTIDQLRSYLTWRNNYGIIISFVRIKTFTKVLRESESSIKSHDSYLNNFRKIDETHFVSNHSLCR